MELTCVFMPCFTNFEQCKIELDILIDSFQKKVENCSSEFHRDVIYMNAETYADLCQDIGWMPLPIARYRGYPIEIDSNLMTYTYKIKREEMNVNRREIVFKPYDENARLELRTNNITICGGRRSGKTLATFNPVPLRYIINKGATILFWADGDKTIVKRSKDDKFDKTKGFLWAYFLKHSGMSRTKANKYLENLEIEDK